MLLSVRTWAPTRALFVRGTAAVLHGKVNCCHHVYILGLFFFVAYEALLERVLEMYVVCATKLLEIRVEKNDFSVLRVV